MKEYKYSDGIGSFSAGDGKQPPKPRRYTIIQSLWTKPCSKEKLQKTMFICALSLAYAHRSGYRVHMHTDSRGVELLKNFGYERLLPTLDKIPDSVPTDLFAAGKFYAMEAEGRVGKVHIDVDVFLKRPILDRFYTDSRIDAICQQEEDMQHIDHSEKIKHMHVLGYPPTTRPNWKGSMNTGTVGFNNAELANKYFDNYFDALKMYTADKFKNYWKKYGKQCLLFDFILEQIELSYLSVGYNVYTLIPSKEYSFVADKIGYQHLQGDWKWAADCQHLIRSFLSNIDARLFAVATETSINIK